MCTPPRGREGFGGKEGGRDGWKWEEREIECHHLVRLYLVRLFPRLHNIKVVYSNCVPLVGILVGILVGLLVGILVGILVAYW